MLTVAGTAPDFHGVPFSSASFNAEPLRLQVAKSHVNHHYSRMKKFSFHSETALYICFVILRQLFTIYIVALLLVPCSDTQACEQTPMAHHEDTQEKDICPPFCICQCCRTAVEEIDLFVWSTTNPKPVDTWTEFVIQAPKAPLHNIWQPPRLV